MAKTGKKKIRKNVVKGIAHVEGQFQQHARSPSPT